MTGGLLCIVYCFPGFGLLLRRTTKYTLIFFSRLLVSSLVYFLLFGLF